MKLRKILAVTFSTAFLLSAVSLQAARNKTQSVFVPYAGTVAGAHLKSGQYHVKFETDGTTAKLTFVLNRKVIATVEGKVVNHADEYSTNQVLYDTKPDGSRTITEIRFANPNQAIVFKE